MNRITKEGHVPEAAPGRDAWPYGLVDAAGGSSGEVVEVWDVCGLELGAIGFGMRQAAEAIEDPEEDLR
tara:strand:- start:156 stop:362 length:207 start_codon:yes stop_codon:yes gene_type:complete